MIDINDKKVIDELFEDVKHAQTLSYSPYSKFRVGAVIYTKDGKKIFGANIENSSYGLSMCAERTAMFKAHLEGYSKEDIEVLALVGDSSTYAYPCGACRQVMSELLSLNCPVIVFSKTGAHINSSVEELLPYTFSKESLN